MKTINKFLRTNIPPFSLPISKFKVIDENQTPNIHVTSKYKTSFKNYATDRTKRLLKLPFPFRIAITHENRTPREKNSTKPCPFNTIKRQIPNPPRVHNSKRKYPTYRTTPLPLYHKDRKSNKKHFGCNKNLESDINEKKTLDENRR